jgi:NTE family protein
MSIPMGIKRPSSKFALILPLLASLTCSLHSQSSPQTPDSAAQAAGQASKTGKASQPASLVPDPATVTRGTSNPGDSKTASESPDTASSTAPAPPPPGPKGRPSIGLALGGGGALAMSEVGVLEWFEDHHIPVDMIAGTSMGAMVGALYSTGKSIDQLKSVMTNEVFTSVFSFEAAYKSRSFRRRQDSRQLPNALTIGLKHGVSLRNSVLIDDGLNAFLDRAFLRYDDQTDFNTLPIPFRCLSTDLNDARTVTFARGSLPEAVRASVSLPGIYQPFELNGHQFVDGAVLENLPTQTVHSMHADVVLAVSLPIKPVAGGDLNSIIGVLQRSFAVAIEANERASRKLADVVIEPTVTGFTDTDYLKTRDLAARGYEAAERQKDALLKYAVSDAEWQAYLALRASRLRGPVGNILRVRVTAPSPDVTRAVQRSFDTLINQPTDTRAIEARLSQIRSDGRYEADYTIGYETPDSNRPIVLVTVTDKKTGPPFLLLGANVEAQAGGVSRATLEGILLDQDFGGYGSELRAHFKVGYLTQIDAEYYRKLADLGHNNGGLFVAPRANLLRQPFNIYQNQHRIYEQLLQTVGGGADIGWSDRRTQELRLGWESNNVRWTTDVGSNAEPSIIGQMQRARLRYIFDTQDRALIPRFGIRWTAEAAYLYNAVDSPNAPQFNTRISFAHEIGKNLFVMVADAGTMLNRNVSQPFRYTLGGPFHLSASAIDEYRGTDYFYLQPAFLHRIAQLPAPLGQSIYLGAAYEAGQMHAPGLPTITRQDAYFGVVAETPLGIITLAPAIGDDGHRKFIFTLGKLF